MTKPTQEDNHTRQVNGKKGSRDPGKLWGERNVAFSHNSRGQERNAPPMIGQLYRGERHKKRKLLPPPKKRGVSWTKEIAAFRRKKAGVSCTKLKAI